MEKPFVYGVAVTDYNFTGRKGYHYRQARHLWMDDKREK